MAKLSAKGGPILEWCSTTTGYSYALRPDRQILRDTGFGWKEWRKVKADVPIGQFIATVKASANAIVGKRAPSWETLNKWSADGIAKATDGCKVEPDGTCRHGHKSWLLIRRLI